MKQVFRSPAFLVLLALGALNSGFGLWFGRDLFGTPTLPLAHVVIPVLKGSFFLFPIIITIYYAGELVWRERDRRLHEIVDATPLPDWAYVVPKTAAIALVLISTLIFSMVVAFGINLGKDWVHFELGKYLLWYLLPMGVDMVMYAILAVFVQSLSPNKYVGWGVMALFIVATIVLPLLGFAHNLYHSPADAGGAALRHERRRHLLDRRLVVPALLDRLLPHPARRLPPALAAGDGDAADAAPAPLPHRLKGSPGRDRRPRAHRLRRDRASGISTTPTSSTITGRSGTARSFRRITRRNISDMSRCRSRWSARLSSTSPSIRSVSMP